MSRQYLHGFGHVTTVLPAGTLKSGEDPLEAAKRELLEETGYVSQDWKLLSSLNSHTNYRGSKVNFFIAVDAYKVSEPKSGDLEEMEIVLLSEAEIIEEVRKSEIKSSGTLTGLMLAKIHLLEVR
jgi:ADP-ribose pyrophosphatase